ncbi:MAG: hypothetical protein ACK5JT_02205 [Hyphomicrobiaceae bacterium]
MPPPPPREDIASALATLEAKRRRLALELSREPAWNALRELDHQTGSGQGLEALQTGAMRRRLMGSLDSKIPDWRQLDALETALSILAGAGMIAAPPDATHEAVEQDKLPELLGHAPPGDPATASPPEMIVEEDFYPRPPPQAELPEVSEDVDDILNRIRSISSQPRPEPEAPSAAPRLPLLPHPAQRRQPLPRQQTDDWVTGEARPTGHKTQPSTESLADAIRKVSRQPASDTPPAQSSFQKPAADFWTARAADEEADIEIVGTRRAPETTRSTPPARRLSPPTKSRVKRWDAPDAPPLPPDVLTNVTPGRTDSDTYAAYHDDLEEADVEIVRHRGRDQADGKQNPS